MIMNAITRLVWVFSLPTAWALYADMSAPSWNSLLERFGLPTALVVFFVWQWYLDKTRMSSRITTLESFVEGKLVEFVTVEVESRKTLSMSLDRLTDASAKHAIAIDNFASAISHAPCGEAAKNKGRPT